MSILSATHTLGSNLKPCLSTAYEPVDIISASSINLIWLAIASNITIQQALTIINESNAVNVIEGLKLRCIDFIFTIRNPVTSD